MRIRQDQTQSPFFLRDHCRSVAQPVHETVWTAGPFRAAVAGALCRGCAFQDPTQERHGIAAYIAAQEGLIQRCDDVYLTPSAVLVDGDTAFVEWEMGLKIKGIEFIYPGSSRLRFDQQGLVCDHRDYFDFVGPTFAPVPVVGGFVRWLYRRFVD